MEYRNLKIIDFPSGMGGSFPGACASESGGFLRVICLHPDFSTGKLIAVPVESAKPMSYRFTEKMKKIIDRHLGAQWS